MFVHNVGIILTVYSVSVQIFTNIGDYYQHVILFKI